MDFKTYLLETFAFNDVMNRRMVEKINTLPDPTECIRLFSHLINSQIKWMARLTKDPDLDKRGWWDPTYTHEYLVERWNASLQPWVTMIGKKSLEELQREVTFTGRDGARWVATPIDIMLQLNYHSIHHRAQMQVDIRRQGVEPDFIDYIGTKYRRLGDA